MLFTIYIISELIFKVTIEATFIYSLCILIILRWSFILKFCRFYLKHQTFHFFFRIIYFSRRKLKLIIHDGIFHLWFFIIRKPLLFSLFLILLKMLYMIIPISLIPKPDRTSKINFSSTWSTGSSLMIIIVLLRIFTLQFQ